MRGIAALLRRLADRLDPPEPRLVQALRLVREQVEALRAEMAEGRR